MNVKLEYRKYKVSKLINKPYHSELFDFILINMTGLTIYKHNDYPEFLIFGKSKDNIIFDYDKNNNDLWIDHRKLWLTLKEKYLLNDIEINYLFIYN